MGGTNIAFPVRGNKKPKSPRLGLRRRVLIIESYEKGGAGGFLEDGNRGR